MAPARTTGWQPSLNTRPWCHHLSPSPPAALVSSDSPEHPPRWLQQLHEARGHATETEPPGLGLSSGEKRWKETQIVILITALLRHISHASLSTHSYSLHDSLCKTAYSHPETKLHPSTLSLLGKPQVGQDAPPCSSAIQMLHQLDGQSATSPGTF